MRWLNLFLRAEETGFVYLLLSQQTIMFHGYFFISQNQMFDWLCCLNCLTIDWFIDLINWMSRYMYILAAHFVICLCISCLVGGALCIHWKRTNQGHQGKWKNAEQPSASSRKLPKFEPKNSAWQIKSMFFIKTIPVGVKSKSRIGKNFYEYGNMVTFLPYL